MKIEVDYGLKIYGNGTNANQYRVTISGEEQLSLRFIFAEDQWGQSENSWRVVSGGTLTLPKRQARSLAASILWYLEQSELQSNPSSIELKIDENDFISLSSKTITVLDLSKSIKVSYDRVLEEMKLLGIPNTGLRSYISLQDAEKIREKITNPPESTGGG